MTYQERMKALRAKKIADTKAKMTQQGYMDADDYGTVPLPEGYHFEPTKKDGGIFGPAACIENYERFMENHPIYVDPLEILAGRWRDRFDKYREDFPWPDYFSYDHLKPLQELYDTNPGIAKWAHFAADYSIGMRLGWGGLLQKVRRYRTLNRDPEKEVFYDAEERTVLAIQGFIARHIPEIERLLASETRPEIQATLRDMLEANKNIIDKPPATFLEACQWMAWFATVSRMYNRDGAGCQLDVMLLPYYERDKKAGILDDEKAK
ncbi:MAG: formate acetyltransferase, partial [Clostridia bacterium]|nr:formate acetyltransferase [Clostridia bacterium]